MQTINKAAFLETADKITAAGKKPILIERGFVHYLGHLDRNGEERAVRPVATPKSWDSRVKYRERFTKWLTERENKTNGKA